MSTNGTLQTNESQPPTLPASVSLERITELDPLLARLSRIWASRTGENADELYSSIHFEIAQHALLQPDFLDAHNTDSFIVNFGLWRTRDGYRSRQSHDAATHAQSLDEDDLDEMIGAARDDDPAAVLATLLDGLDEDGQELVEAIIAGGEGLLFRNGELNASALARQMGMPVRKINRHMRKMQRQARALAKH